MKFIKDILKHSAEYNAVSDAVRSSMTPAVVTGLSSIHKSMLCYSLFKEHGRKVLFLCPDEADCYKVFQDLNSMGLKCSLYPSRDFNLRDAAISSHEYEQQRLEALTRFISGNCDCIVASIDAALQYTLPKSDLEKRTTIINSGESFPQNKLLELLLLCGYQRAEQIDGIGQFSHRGGIVDFYPPGSSKPIRIEYWGDDIDSISSFDMDTQRREENLDFVNLSPSLEVIPKSNLNLSKKIREYMKTIKGKHAPKVKENLEKDCQKLDNGLHIYNLDKYISLIYDKPSTLFDYFKSDDSLVVYSEFSKLKDRLKTTSWQWSEDIKDLLNEGMVYKGIDKFSEDFVYALTKSEELPSLFLDTFARGTYEVPTKALVNMNVKQVSLWGGSNDLLIEDLHAFLHRKLRCVVLGGTEKAAINLANDLKAAGIPADYLKDFTTVQKSTVIVTNGSLSAGVEIPSSDFVLISQGRITSSSDSTKKKKKKNKHSQDIYSLAELSVGDYVVHSTHGIGVFLGIHKIEVKGILKDYIKIEYAKKDVLYVPVTQLDMVAKYIGPKEDNAVKLHRIGGAEWQKAKTRVRSAVKDIAMDLIKLYAKRMEQKGFAFPEDDTWQRDFESYFEYEETEDQLRCISEIKNDMESIVPMERLLCGDVGFGKTEVALRAAFKCVTAGKQCAILVPTTILAWQHFQSVLKRMENFPINVELLSRFRTPRQQDEIIRKLKSGSVDVVVGTHRLVSKDVQFRDLGLVIIDEEQRFGVAQKEKFKEMCTSTDVLTLSATPIPRTLNMALSGIRDMSVIEEAPHDRHPVQSYVLEYDSGIITDAINKELRRGGQVFYLHNDVASIERVASGINSRIPSARIGIGHGKMEEHELSEVWRQLVEHEIDVLVCTTIIETGVDIPNANTLIIDNADKMGLSQLHQIRGRVGRSNRRAYAYFTYAPNKVLSEIAQKRLSAIREFTEFGSGFKIAIRDLEIRGAGNVLGGEQHGHMENVGYDMYLKLLNEAVSLIKGEEPPVENRECTVDMQMNAHIPEDYISSTSQRLEVYRKIADIRDYDDSCDVIDELIDRFGEPPAAVQGLIDIALLRSTAASLYITEVKQQGQSILLYLDRIDMEKISKLIGAMKGKVLLNAGTSPYLSIKLSGREAIDVLEDALKAMSE